MEPIKQLAWRRRATAQADKLMRQQRIAAIWNETLANLASVSRLSPASFQPLEFERRIDLDKDDLLAAEVSLPLYPACDVSQLRSVRMRRPYSLCAELMLVDVSRLPAP